MSKEVVLQALWYMDDEDSYARTFPLRAVGLSIEECLKKMVGEIMKYDVGGLWTPAWTWVDNGPEVKVYADHRSRDLVAEGFGFKVPF